MRSMELRLKQAARKKGMELDPQGVTEFTGGVSRFNDELDDVFCAR